MGENYKKIFVENFRQPTADYLDINTYNTYNTYNIKKWLN